MMLFSSFVQYVGRVCFKIYIYIYILISQDSCLFRLVTNELGCKCANACEVYFGIHVCHFLNTNILFKN